MFLVRPLIQPRQSDRRKGEILDAALSVFLERGVAAARVEEIRDRSAASIGSIYHHFGSKEGVAAALRLDCAGDYQAGFLAELGRRRTARSGILAGVGQHLGWAEGRPDRAQFLLGGRGLTPVAAGWREHSNPDRDFVVSVAGWMAPYIATGEVGELPVEEFSALWLGAADHYVGQWLAGGPDRRPSEVAGLFGEAAWQVLKQGARD